MSCCRRSWTDCVLVAFAIDEAARHDPSRLALTAVAEGNGYRLNGTKRLVVDGGVADTLLLAVVGEAGPMLLRVEAQTPGVQVTSLALMDNRNAADIVFTDVRVDGGAVLAEGDAAARAIARTLDVGRALLAAELLGLAEEAFERTVAYLKERVQFGAKIGSFQALQHRAARMHISIELAVGVVLKALPRPGRGRSRRHRPGQPRQGGDTTRTARDVMNEAVQLHGGIGLTDEFDIGFFLKRARVAGETFGDDYFHKDRLAQLAWRL